MVVQVVVRVRCDSVVSERQLGMNVSRPGCDPSPALHTGRTTGHKLTTAELPSLLYPRNVSKTLTAIAAIASYKTERIKSRGAGWKLSTAIQILSMLVK